MSNRQQYHPPMTKQPVHIRRNVESAGDPYIDEEHLPEFSICTRCGSVNSADRWYPSDQLPHGFVRSAAHGVVCPACRKLQDHMPGGVLRITGDFVWQHKDEILNLIRNESGKALAANPLERIMSLESTDGGLEITTTNEKLAQRIGKALHKAYAGTVEYRWSADTKLARVLWNREA